ncbi:hypothetical protein BB558_006491 [Smittium angustum]|uniref:Cytosol aminopeptidase domain-containing protein n=1 Tax=Smittium angustum TaxID=133377 RepID=A0A2U1IXL9_SMIAN|nr:hypothetical protein BB558_006491 [Smittium angustum]
MLSKVTISQGQTVFNTQTNDALVSIYDSAENLATELGQDSQISANLSTLGKADASAHKSLSFIPCSSAPGNRLILSPVGTLNNDCDDVRKIRNATRDGISRAIKAGSRNPILYLSNLNVGEQPFDADYSRWVEVAILAAFEVSYVTLVAREWNHARNLDQSANEKLDSIHIELSPSIQQNSDIQIILERAIAIEKGKRLYKDMGYGDPERMTPYKVAEYVEQTLSNIPGITISVNKDLESIKKNYPLLYHSARASFDTEHTRPCIVELNYLSPDQGKVEEELYLVGKGVTYDTGGISIKVGAGMRGMSRDKLGACAVAGFVYTAALLQSERVNITGILTLERNSVGPNCLLPDEVIPSRAGVRVHIVNTDAEGRLVMTDPLAECKERILAQREVSNKLSRKLNQTVYTIATLTGHVIRAYGGYGATVANGPARASQKDRKFAKSGTVYGDPFENSIMRQDDYDYIAAHTDREDVFQVGPHASSATDRGHQFPAAYMVVAAGLDKHGMAAEPDQRIDYIHLDIAGSAEEFGSEKGLGLPSITGSPISVLVHAHLE